MKSSAQKLIEQPLNLFGQRDPVPIRELQPPA